MTHARGIFWGWLLALTVLVTAAFPHMSFANYAPSQSEAGQPSSVHQTMQTDLDCHSSGTSHEKTGGCGAMMAHCSSLLPQPTLLPKQMPMQISVEYSFGIVVPYQLPSFSETPPPRG